MATNFLSIEAVLFWSPNKTVYGEIIYGNTNDQSFAVAEAIFGRIVTVVTSFWLLLKILKMQMACTNEYVIGAGDSFDHELGLRSFRDDSLYHGNQRLSIFSTILFFLLYSHIESGPVRLPPYPHCTISPLPFKLCSTLCVLTQYCFVVFMTLTILEFAHMEGTTTHGRRSQAIGCLIGWSK